MELLLAGPATAWSERRLPGLLADSGLDGRTQVLGRCDGAAKWEFLASADLLVLCSELENFGMVVIEALACGTPILVTSAVGCAEAIGCTGGAVVCEPGCDSIARSFADAIRRGSAPGTERDAIRRRTLAAFSHEPIARELAAFYASLCKL